MTPLIRLSELPVIHALGWTLVHFFWQGTLVAITLACLLALMGNRFAQLRYRITCLALILMITLPPFTLHRLLATGSANLAVAERGSAMRPMVVQTVKTLPQKMATATVYLQSVETFLDRTIPWILLVWFVGMLTLFGRLYRGLRAAQRIKVLYGRPGSSELQDLLKGLKRRLKIQRPIRLLTAAISDVPIVIGWLCPIVVLPESCFSGLPKDQIEAILAHELGHVKRQDFLVNVFQGLVEAVFFYHPAVWWISTQLRTEREHCCDDIAIGVSTDRFAYAKTLTFLEERRSLPSIAVFGANGGVLRLRIRRLLGMSDTRWASRLGACVFLATTLVTGTLVYRLPWAVLAVPASSPTRQQMQDENLSPKQLADIRHYGITSSFVQGIEALGLRTASVDQLVQLKQYGVSPEYAAAIARAHVDNLTLDELIRFSQYDVTPEYATGMSATGVRDPEQIVSLQQQGITVAQVNELRAAGFRNPSPEKVVSQIHPKQKDKR